MLATSKRIGHGGFVIEKSEKERDRATAVVRKQWREREEKKFEIREGDKNK